MMTRGLQARAMAMTTRCRIPPLSSWGYKKGTISDIIKQILEKSETPLTREEIVKQVLKVRKVKETTILLNLQNKKLFKKVDKNLYTLA